MSLKQLIPGLMMSLIFTITSSMANEPSVAPVLVPTIMAPPGVKIDVSTVGFIHVPHRKKDLVDKPIPMQVVTKITNTSQKTVSWSVKPESLHFWHLEDIAGKVIETSAAIKATEPGLTQLVIELAPNQSIETRELITVGYDKLKPENAYTLKYTYWGLRNGSQFEAIDGLRLSNPKANATH